MKRRDKILNALIQSDTLTQAAQMAGCTRKTLYNHINNDSELIAEYSALCDRITTAKLEQLEKASSTAFETITEVMQDKALSPSARLKAAELILSAASAARTENRKYIERVTNSNQFLNLFAGLSKQLLFDDLPENTQESE